MGNATHPSECPIRSFCPEGSAAPSLCTDGTWTNSTGLTSASDCSACPATFYCVNGEVAGHCAAGYICYSGAPSPSPGIQGPVLAKTAGPCSTGHYCPAGTDVEIPCPDGTVRGLEGGQKASDCGPCPAGFVCVDGDPVAYQCPRGYYCALEQSAEPCPLGSYNADLQGEDLTDCAPCPAGYLCDDVAISNLLLHTCPAGSYCEEGASEKQPCPGGTFRTTPAATAASDCTMCPAGYYCPVESISPTVCPEEHYCLTNSSEPTLCSPGFVCPVNSVFPIVCPGGSYCPLGAVVSIPCLAGHYCPEGSSEPEKCPAGTLGLVDGPAGKASAATACQLCPAGTGSSLDRLSCEACEAGYVCLGGTHSSQPTEDEHNGYVCPVGYYCPEGSSEELPCPPGFYAANTMTTLLSGCTPCQANSYNPKYGQKACLPCGASAYSGAGASECACRGSHRTFQASDGQCLCDSGYEYFASDLKGDNEDNSAGCQSVVYDRCDQGDTRTADGTCLSNSDEGVYCNSRCPTGFGLYRKGGNSH